MDSQNSTVSGGSNYQPNTPPTSAPSGKNIPMGVLAYIGPLVIVSYITAKDDPFVKFHIKQGLVIFVIEVGVWVLGMIMWQLYPLLSIINLAALVFSVLGIINVVKGEEKELPLIGQFSKYFPI